MPRLCERPGCSAVATVAYGFDTADLVVWLSPFEGDDKARPYGSGILCRRHADALVVPRGWRVDDRREAVPRLFLAPETNQRPAEPTAPARARTSRDKLRPAADLFDGNVAAPVPDEPVLEETRAIPWSPQMLETLEDTVNPLPEDDPNAPKRGSLLGRAFGNKDRRDRQ